MTLIVPLNINKTMTFTGIADWQVRSYNIDGSSFPEKHFSSTVWHTEASGLEDKFIVQGIMVYSPNGTKLLCPEEIKPIYKKRIHFVPWNTQHDRDIAAELKKAFLVLIILIMLSIRIYNAVLTRADLVLFGSVEGKSLFLTEFNRNGKI